MKQSRASSFKSSNYNGNNDKTVNDDNDNYQWGTRLNIRKRNVNQNNGTKRVFNVVWRDVTTKKHKTWRGDGTLEVDSNTSKIVLLNEDGSYLACTNIINNLSHLQADFQMIVGSKEIEIQNEMLDTNELYKVSNRLTSSTNCDEQMSSSSSASGEKTKIPKGAFIFKPSLILNKLKPTLTKKQSFKCNSNIKQNATVNEYICLIKPSELQEYLFRKIHNFYSDRKQPDSMELIDLLQDICNHPSVLNHKSIKNEQLHDALTTSLPNWNEMGIFDSGKMEFIQQQIINVKNHTEGQFISVIIADRQDSINMLEELCTFLNIKHKRFEEDDDIEYILKDIHIVILSSKGFKQYIENFLDFTKEIIVFENVHSLLGMGTSEVLYSSYRLKNDIFIYHLITSFSIEDLLLYHHLTNTQFYNNIDEFFKELTKIDEEERDNLLHPCYVAWKIHEDVAKVFNEKWQYIPGPFVSNSLETMHLNNELDNLSAIFKRKFHT